MPALPSPPFDHPLSWSGQLAMTAGTSIVALVVLAMTVRFARRHQVWWPYVIVGSSTLCLFVEPLYDVTFHVWFYRTGGLWTAYETFGNHQPIWVPITYTWVYGGQAIVVAAVILRGGTRRDVIQFALIASGVFTAFELIGINLGTYEYYGPHPFRVFGHPVWLSVANTAIVVVAGIVTALAVSRLRGVRLWLLLPVVPACFALVSFGTSFLVLDVINTPRPDPALMYVTTLLSVGLQLAVCAFALTAVRTEPAEQNTLAVLDPVLA